MKKSQMTYAIWPWGTQTREQAIEAARDVTSIGYKSFESVKSAMYAYDLDHKAYKEMLDSYGLKPVSFYFHIPDPGEEDEKLFANLDKELEFVVAMGVNIVTLQGTHGRPEVMDEAAKRHNLDNMIKFAKIAKKYGITTNVHPHVNTYFMFEDEAPWIRLPVSVFPDQLSVYSPWLNRQSGNRSIQTSNVTAISCAASVRLNSAI